ncbi:hypothetical protein HPB49_011982 [Dermacentor silvarum]|uniref:Uncharacterized protein n=1 Tax=Dermacentor silvarum TaxID=543639 RepID=A0ACB8CF59_DERSI|nr:hypothetical protein HPB49_011982 [Dermacentor silvarum]
MVPTRSFGEMKLYIFLALLSTALAAVCHKPPFSGPCMSSVPRFYYDQKTNSCRPFVYGGCMSNGNNFESHTDCMRLCGSVKPGQPTPLVA